MTPSIPAPPINILLVEDHTLLREGLRSLMANRERFCVVGEAVTAEEGLELARQEKPDIVLLGLLLRDGNSLPRIREFYALRVPNKKSG